MYLPTFEENNLKYLCHEWIAAKRLLATKPDKKLARQTRRQLDELHNLITRIAIDAVGIDITT